MKWTFLAWDFNYLYRTEAWLMRHVNIWYIYFHRLLCWRYSLFHLHLFLKFVLHETCLKFEDVRISVCRNYFSRIPFFLSSFRNLVNDNPGTLHPGPCFRIWQKFYDYQFYTVFHGKIPFSKTNHSATW